MEPGETAVCASVDAPAPAYIPGLTMQASKGFGRSNLTVNVGGAPAAVETGLNRRYHLAPTLATQEEVQGARVTNDWHRTSVLGVQTLATQDFPFHLGAYGGVLSGRKTKPPKLPVRPVFASNGRPDGRGWTPRPRPNLANAGRSGNQPAGAPTEDTGLPPGHLSFTFFRLRD